MRIEIDEKDQVLLTHLQTNGRATSAELASQVDLSVSGVQKWLKKLEESGVIERYTAVLNRQAVGYDMLCFVEVTLRGHESDSVANFDAVVQQMPEILECHRLTGSADYLLKVTVRNREHLDHFLMKEVLSLRSVDRLQTSVVLREIKETTAVGVGNEPDLHPVDIAEEPHPLTP